MDTLVVAEVPHPTEAGRRLPVVKRVRSRGDSTVYLGSDNPLEGRDSRHFGSVALEHVVGGVVLHLEVAKARDQLTALGTRLTRPLRSTDSR